MIKKTKKKKIELGHNVEKIYWKMPACIAVAGDDQESEMCSVWGNLLMPNLYSALYQIFNIEQLYHEIKLSDWLTMRPYIRYVKPAMLMGSTFPVVYV